MNKIDIAKWSGTIPAGGEVHVDIVPIDFIHEDVVHLEIGTTTPPVYLLINIEIGIFSDYADYMGFKDELVFDRYVFESIGLQRVYGRLEHDGLKLNNVILPSSRNHKFYLKNNNDTPVTIQFRAWIERRKAPIWQIGVK